MVSQPGRGAAPPAPRDERASARERVKTLGLVQILLGGVGLASLLHTYVAQFTKDPTMRRVQAVLWTGDLGTWTNVSVIVGALLGTLVIAAGVCVQRHLPVGRILTFIHAAVALVTATSSLYLLIALFWPAMDRLTAVLGPAGRAAAIGGFAGGLFGAVMSIAFPVAELWMITRPGTREVFDTPRA